MILKKFGFDRMIVNSSADWSDSDPLAVPKTAALLRSKRYPASVIKQVFYDNPYNFYKMSGKFELPND